MEHDKSSDQWIHEFSGSSPSDRLHFLAKCIGAPREVPVPTDDRSGETAIEAVVNAARQDPDLRDSISEAILNFFEKLPGIDEHGEEERTILLASSLIAMQLPSPNYFDPLRAWFSRNSKKLDNSENAESLKLTLRVIALVQREGDEDTLQFWLQLWRSPNPIYWPIAYKGIRRNNPEIAATEIPTLLRYCAYLEEDPGPMLHGLWIQHDGRDAILSFVEAKRMRDPNLTKTIVTSLGPRLSQTGEHDLKKASKPRGRELLKGILLRQRVPVGRIQRSQSVAA